MSRRPITRSGASSVKNRRSTTASPVIERDNGHLVSRVDRREQPAAPDRSDRSHAEHFHDDAFLSPAIELRVEHLLPWAEIERAVGDRQITWWPMIVRFKWASALSSPV